jgi:putative ABC transport system permease protein
MWWNTVRLALREIQYNLLRSTLTALGIIIGVAAVIIIVTLGGGATARVTADISSMGRNLLFVTPGQRHRGPDAPARPFTVQDANAILNDINGVEAVAPTATRNATVIFGNKNWNTSINGTNNGYMGVREWPVDKGRPFTDGEEKSGSGVCVIGQTVAKELFGYQNPLGVKIRAAEIPCQVIGILSAKGKSTFGQDQDDVVIMPLRTFHRRIAGNKDVNLIFVSAASAAITKPLQAEIRLLMRQRRNLKDNDDDDFSVNDMQEISDIVESTTGVLTALLGAVAAVSLVVGGIGIMNIMLVSVTERTREIGIRLAIGAQERDVLLQFLIEAMLLALAGGIAGVALGLTISAVASHYLGIPFILNMSIVMVAVIFSAAVGIGFGFFPAKRAAALDPIDALRYE